MEPVTISNAELLLVAIYEKSTLDDLLSENHVVDIVAGSYKLNTKPFTDLKFDYKDEKEFTRDIATLIGIGDVIEKRKGNLGFVWDISSNGKKDAKLIIYVAEKLGMTVKEKAIKSYLL